MAIAVFVANNLITKTERRLRKLYANEKGAIFAHSVGLCK